MHLSRHHTQLSRRSVDLCAHTWIFYLVLCQYLFSTYGSTEKRTATLREDTADLFYHGFENYMKYGFPEDELRPISCTPLSRDRQNPAHVEVNDALGNYSLTLIDSLSTLAILASSASPSSNQSKNKPLLLFQNGIKQLVEQYGDGTDGESGRGLRARGFDLDSKVQLFETAIRGLGGLLSAHLFAVGDLPIRGYNPPALQAAVARAWDGDASTETGIKWQNGLTYNGQLLRLAYDLGQRLLPAFWTATGIPYPRVNLRDGIPFYANSPRNQNPVEGQCNAESTGHAEVTETCSAGAGSLVLEFTVLSRLTGDPRFEDLAKRAFWAIWSRRSDIGLIGAGIDAETGLWVNSYTGIGAGIDSFFEYAFKSYILLSSDFHPNYSLPDHVQDPRLLFEPLSDYERSASSFLQAWEFSHAAIKRNLLRSSNYQHPHYIQVDLFTGAARAFWIDALSAYYPGLLTISGHVEEAIEAHLLTTALWTRFSALPERWNVLSGGIEGGLGWWVGRPEFIESNYYLYRATEDPWYKYVAEMTLLDIKRRCWTQCGWASIQNVLTGEKADRMESFFLGETAKYLFLTFDEDHPLNRMDAPFVFSTEGHPLIIPKSAGSRGDMKNTPAYIPDTKVCPAKPPTFLFSTSSTAGRNDVYHAASLARLHEMPKRDQVGAVRGEYAIDHPSLVASDVSSPSNFTYYPWTMPPELIPYNAVSSPMQTRPTFDITFPNIPSGGQSIVPLQRIKNGILVNFLGGVRLGMTQDVPVFLDDKTSDGYRIHSVNNIFLGKDEKIYLPRDTGLGLVNPTDPNFTRIRDVTMLDIVLVTKVMNQTDANIDIAADGTNDNLSDMLSGGDSTMKLAWSSLVSHISSLVHDASTQQVFSNAEQLHASEIAAIVPTGVGAAPIPDWIEAPTPKLNGQMETSLPWDAMFLTDELCDHKLAASIPRRTQVIVIKRGGCTFSKKISNIPTFTPSSRSLQLVIIVSYGGQDAEIDGNEVLVRPLLDEIQSTSSGLPRQNPLAMVMVAGGEQTYQALKNADSVGIKRRYSVRSQGVPITNLIIT